MTKIVISLFLASAGCTHNEANEAAPTVAIPTEFDLDYATYKADRPIRKTVYLMAGLHATKEYWDSFNLIEELNAAGIDVIIFTLPYFEASMMADDGVSYRALYEYRLHRIMKISDDVFGCPYTRTIIGNSFGGLHALMGASLMSKIDSYFAMISCTRIKALWEYSTLEANHFNPFNELATLKLKKGVITWGTTDDRIDWTLEVSLYNQLNALGANITPYPMIGVGHDVNQDQIDLAVDFVLSL